MKLTHFLIFLMSVSGLLAEVIPEKILICGVCKNVEKAVPNTIASVTALAERFLDYKVVIYENNSQDQTVHLFQQWAEGNPHVLFMTESLDKKALKRQLAMKLCSRVELIARARNRVLDEIEKKTYDDYKYVVWADLDFVKPWDVEHLIETIQHPQQPWDAVLANGAYDLFAFRDRECPVGFELVGNLFWDHLSDLAAHFPSDSNQPWRKVYSAFGGLGIYKKEAIRGCRYSGVVTKELEKAVQGWLARIRSIHEVPLLEEYENLLSTAPVVQCATPRLLHRENYPLTMGLCLHNAYGVGQVVWFSCMKKQTLPTVCEHIPFHAAMAARGHDRIFINPRLKSEL